MSLFEKAEENKLVAEKCKTMGKFNAGVSRAYYSAYQMAKHLLIKNNFSYRNFLNHNSEYNNQREYSHGTISAAVLYLLRRKGVSQADYASLTKLDNLYHRRIKADYYDDYMVSSKDMDNSLRELKAVLEVLKNY